MKQNRHSWSQDFVRSIIPAAPGSFAVYANDRPDDWFVVPIVAWGIIDPVERYCDNGERVPKTCYVKRLVVPMVQDNGGLCSALFSDNYKGSIVAGFYEFIEGCGFDDRFLRRDSDFNTALEELASKFAKEAVDSATEMPVTAGDEQ